MEKTMSNLTKLSIRRIISHSTSDGTPVDDLTVAYRTGYNRYSICDNGEEVSGLTLDQAVEVAWENLHPDR